MSFAGFDLEGVAVLRTRLALAADQAGALSTAIGAAAQEAHEIIVTAGGGTPGVASFAFDDQRRGLSELAAAGPALADQVARRLERLRACEAMVAAGFTVDLAHAFDDAEPPDPQHVTDALAAFRQILDRDHGLNGSTDDLDDLDDVLGDLEDAELEAFVMALSDQDLADWDALARQGDGLFSDNGLTQQQVLWLGNSVLARLPADGVHRLAAGLTVLQPRFSDVDGIDATWQWWPGTLGDPPTLSDLHQGGVGDCWFLAGLGAELQADPDFLSKHVHDNGNGSYTVTFYRDGEPVPVTVSGDLPTSASGGAVFAHPGAWEANGPLWMAIYEKAFARFEGSYGATSGGYGEWSMEKLTGKDARRSKPSFDDLAALVEAGGPVTVGTKDDKTLWFFGDDDDRVDEGKLVSRHEYYVREVKETDDGPLLVVVNPWGAGSGAPDVVELTPDEYDDWIAEASWQEEP